MTLAEYLDPQNFPLSNDARRTLYADGFRHDEFEANPPGSTH